jgi:hypothetical protein
MGPMSSMCCTSSCTRLDDLNQGTDTSKTKTRPTALLSSEKRHAKKRDWMFSGNYSQENVRDVLKLE